MIPASFGCDDDVDGEMLAGAAQLVFQAAGVADTAFRVIDETQQMRASSSSTIALDVGAYLVHEILSAKPGPGFLHHDGQAVVIQKKCGAGCAIGIGRGPLIRPDVVEVYTEQRMHQVLEVELVFDVHGRPILAA